MATTEASESLSTIAVKIILDDGTPFAISLSAGRWGLSPELAERISGGIATGLRGVGFEPSIVRTFERTES